MVPVRCEGSCHSNPRLQCGPQTLLAGGELLVLAMAVGCGGNSDKPSESKHKSDDDHRSA